MSLSEMRCLDKKRQDKTREREKERKREREREREKGREREREREREGLVMFLKIMITKTMIQRYNDTMSNDEVIASDVPPRYLFLLVSKRGGCYLQGGS